MDKTSRGLIVLGTVVALLGLLPWNLDVDLRAIMVLVGFALILAAFPRHRFPLTSRRFAWRLEHWADDDDDK